MELDTDSSDEYSLHGNCGTQPKTWKRDTPQGCQTLCKSVNDCKYFTWIPPTSPWKLGRNRCCLKSKDNIGFADTKNQGLVSGPRYCGRVFLLLDPKMHSNLLLYID